ncbi:MAG: hypothetical protein IT449_09450 [Phycisphaerales bacterium]|nr:hypothetical protein [Phycisphaerales bacterium]
MYRVAVLAVALFGSSPVSGENLLDQIRMLDFEEWDRANGNAIGGDEVFGGHFALQVADDFLTTTTGYVITEVEVANLKVYEEDLLDARLSFFRDLGGVPAEEAIFTAKASDLGAIVVNRSFSDGVFGLVGRRTTFSNLDIGLAPSTGYFMCLQVYSGGDWAFTIRSSFYSHNGADSYLRDGPADEGEGGYGWTTWRSGADTDYGPGDSACRIEATGRTCTGNERIAKARCAQRNGVDKLTVKLADGTPRDSFSVDLSSGETQSGALDAEGRARVRFKPISSGDGAATAIWGCGTAAQRSYTCP